MVLTRGLFIVAAMSDRADAARCFNRKLQVRIREEAPNVIPGWDEMATEKQLEVSSGVPLRVSFEVRIDVGAR